MARILIVSDLHYASEAEKAREHSDLAAAQNWIQKIITRTWGHYFWLRAPCSHNHRFAEILAQQPRPDWLIANGDYTADNAFVGVSDDASFESASLCIGQLRNACPGRVLLNIGDHDLGKKSLFGGAGGLRIKSLERMTDTLQVPLVWKHEIDSWVLVGIASSVAALPVFAEETLETEWAQWEDARNRLLSQIRQIFDGLHRSQQVILFVHDPSALPTLHREPSIQRRFTQIHRTVIGHLHTSKVLRAAKILAGFPTINWLGHTARRYSRALSQSRTWKDFKVILCPSPTGMQIFKDGGYLTLHLPPNTDGLPIFEHHRLRWSQSHEHG